MFEFNNFQVSGNLGSDAAISYLPDGTAIVKFSLANNRTVKGKKITTWVNCSWFGNVGANLAQYLLKGKGVFVTGPIELQTYTDKSGTERTSLSLRVDNLQLLDAKKEGSDDVPANTAVDADDEVPF